MTHDKLHELVKSVEAPDTVDSLYNGFYTLTVDEMLLLCHRAQAQALREAAKDPRCGETERRMLLDMADELESKK